MGHNETPACLYAIRGVYIFAHPYKEIDMKTYETVLVSSIRNLEVGDTIAMGFFGGVISGKVTGIAHVIKDLTEEQLEYLKRKGIDLPKGDEFTPISNGGACLVFGDFVEAFPRWAPAQGNLVHHMFLEYNKTVAFFPEDRGSVKS